MIHAEGMEAVWARHKVLAQAVWAACEAWSADGSFALNVTDRHLRSHAVTALQLDSPKATALREWTETNIGLTLGIGLGMAPSDDPAWHGFFRLGHMGHVNGHMVLGMLGGIEVGLTSLKIRHGSGALDAAARVIAQV
jgi:alanine-glyoxylate transaminase/serine-glyoxylate transaminase/serine-pyruvate transaminase